MHRGIRLTEWTVLALVSAGLIINFLVPPKQPPILEPWPNINEADPSIFGQESPEKLQPQQKQEALINGAFWLLAALKTLITWVVGNTNAFQMVYDYGYYHGRLRGLIDGVLITIGMLVVVRLFVWTPRSHSCQ